MQTIQCEVYHVSHLVDESTIASDRKRVLTAFAFPVCEQLLECVEHSVRVQSTVSVDPTRSPWHDNRYFKAMISQVNSLFNKVDRITALGIAPVCPRCCGELYQSVPEEVWKRSGSLWRAADLILVELMQNQSVPNSEKYVKQWKQF